MANENTKVKRTIPYRFVCEHCGTQTSWKEAHVSGDSYEAIDRVELPKVRGEVERGNYFDLNNINGKCEHCGGHQSWELGEAKAWMMRSPLMGLGLGCMIGGIGAFLTVFFFGLLGAFLLFVGLSILGMIGAFIYGLARYVIIKSHMKKTHVRYIPELIWYAEQTQPDMTGQTLAPPVGTPVVAAQPQLAAPAGEPQLITQFAAPVGQPRQVAQYATSAAQPPAAQERAVHSHYAPPQGNAVQLTYR